MTMISYMDGTQISSCTEPCLNTYVNVLVFLIVFNSSHILDIRFYHHGQELDKRCFKIWNHYRRCGSHNRILLSYYDSLRFPVTGWGNNWTLAWDGSYPIVHLLQQFPFYVSEKIDLPGVRGSLSVHLHQARGVFTEKPEQELWLLIKIVLDQLGLSENDH